MSDVDVLFSFEDKVLRWKRSNVEATRKLQSHVGRLGKRDLDKIFFGQDVVDYVSTEGVGVVVVYFGGHYCMKCGKDFVSVDMCTLPSDFSGMDEFTKVLKSVITKF